MKKLLVAFAAVAAFSAHAAETLTVAASPVPHAEILEFVKPALAKEGVDIVREVGSPNVKLLYDIYHQQISEGNVIDTITANIGAISHFHMGDVPGRHEPGTGELNYRNVFKKIEALGYKGFVGMEFAPVCDPAKAVKDTMALAK